MTVPRGHRRGCVRLSARGRAIARAARRAPGPAAGPGRTRPSTASVGTDSDGPRCRRAADGGPQRRVSARQEDGAGASVARVARGVHSPTPWSDRQTRVRRPTERRTQAGPRRDAWPPRADILDRRCHRAAPTFVLIVQGDAAAACALEVAVRRRGHLAHADHHVRSGTKRLGDLAGRSDLDGRAAARRRRARAVELARRAHPRAAASSPP
jgi:hypothetical protein